MPFIVLNTKSSIFIGSTPSVKALRAEFGWIWNSSLCCNLRKIKGTIHRLIVVIVHFIALAVILTRT